MRSRSRVRTVLSFVALAMLLSACGARPPESLTVEVLEQHAHDPQAFTQGLLYDAGAFYESTGLVGRSSLREVDPTSGEIVRIRSLPSDLFAEGLALVGERLYQLTWRAGTVFVWDRATFNPIGSFTYEGEGWGLCYDGTDLYMSDGSASLTVRDPTDFRVTRTVAVRDGTRPVKSLNELECVGDSIYANVWLTDEIVRVDKRTGRVTARIDASPLRRAMPDLKDPDAVLNGIARGSDADTLWLTGKLWPQMFKVRLVPR